jgi:excisionase family DNA binding protein
VTARERKLIDDGFASIADAAKFLAISRSRLYELVHGGVITHARLGGKLVVSRAAMREYAAGLLKLGSVA